MRSSQFPLVVPALLPLLFSMLLLPQAKAQNPSQDKQTGWLGRVSVQLTAVDDRAMVFLNDKQVLERSWGVGEGGTDIGHAPGRSEVVDLSEAMKVGINRFRFLVWNDALCCGVSGYLSIWVGDELVYENGISEEDSTEGIKLDDDFTLIWLGVGEAVTRYYTLNIQSDFGGGVLKKPSKQIYEEGAEVTLLASALRGFRFSGWAGADAGDLSNPQSNLSTITMDASKTLEAQFEIAGAEGEDTPTLEGCQDDCADTPREDADSDGLSACVENCLGSSDGAVDSDQDGIPDPFEAKWGMDPARDDALEDPDGNGVINLREYLEGVTRFNALTGGTTYLVSPNGVDSPDGGGLLNPWATISYALSQINPSREAIARISIVTGEYVENIQMKSWVILSGALGGGVQIRGAIQGAHNSGLENLRLEATGADDYLLDMNNVRMKISQVLFRGTALRESTGILMDGEESANAVIEQCAFSRLAVGLDIGGALPNVRRCVFDDIAQAGIIVRRQAKALDGNKGLGDATTATSGWNYFTTNIDGPAIINERDVTLKMENNDWGTDDPEEIEARIEGPADYEPALATGNSFLAASLFCTVWDNADQMPILDAAVTVTPSAYTTVTENEEGIYSFPAIPEGGYTVSVSAPGYKAQTQFANVKGGDITSVLLPLIAEAAEGEPEGEGEGEGETPPGCACSKEAPFPPAPADAFIGALSLLVLCIATRKRHP